MNANHKRGNLVFGLYLTFVTFEACPKMEEQGIGLVPSEACWVDFKQYIKPLVLVCDNFIIGYK